MVKRARASFTNLYNTAGGMYDETLKLVKVFSGAMKTVGQIVHAIADGLKAPRSISKIAGMVKNIVGTWTQLRGDIGAGFDAAAVNYGQMTAQGGSVAGQMATVSRKAASLLRGDKAEGGDNDKSMMDTLFGGKKDVIISAFKTAKKLKVVLNDYLPAIKGALKGGAAPQGVLKDIVLRSPYVTDFFDDVETTGTEYATRASSALHGVVANVALIDEGRRHHAHRQHARHRVRRAHRRRKGVEKDSNDASEEEEDPCDDSPSLQCAAMAILKQPMQIVQTIKDMANVDLSILIPIGSTAEGKADAIAFVKEVKAELKSQYASHWKRIKDFGMERIQESIAAFQDGLADGLDAVEELKLVVLSAPKRFLKALQDALPTKDAMVSAVMDVVTMLKTDIASTLQAAKDSAFERINDMVVAFSDAKDAAKAMAGEAAKKASDAVIILRAAFKVALARAMAAAGSKWAAAKKMGMALVAVAKGSLTAMKGAVVAAFDATKSLAISFVEAVKKVGAILGELPAVLAGVTFKTFTTRIPPFVKTAKAGLKGMLIQVKAVFVAAGAKYNALPFIGEKLEKAMITVAGHIQTAVTKLEGGAKTEKGEGTLTTVQALVYRAKNLVLDSDIVRGYFDGASDIVDGALPNPSLIGNLQFAGELSIPKTATLLFVEIGAHGDPAAGAIATPLVAAPPPSSLQPDKCGDLSSAGLQCVGRAIVQYPLELAEVFKAVTKLDVRTCIPVDADPASFALFANAVADKLASGGGPAKGLVNQFRVATKGSRRLLADSGVDPVEAVKTAISTALDGFRGQFAEVLKALSGLGALVVALPERLRLMLLAVEPTKLSITTTTKEFMTSFAEDARTMITNAKTIAVERLGAVYRTFASATEDVRVFGKMATGDASSGVDVDSVLSVVRAVILVALENPATPECAAVVARVEKAREDVKQLYGCAKSMFAETEALVDAFRHSFKAVTDLAKTISATLEGKTINAASMAKIGRALIGTFGKVKSTLTKGFVASAKGFRDLSRTCGPAATLMANLADKVADKLQPKSGSGGGPGGGMQQIVDEKITPIVNKIRPMFDATKEVVESFIDTAKAAGETIGTLVAIKPSDYDSHAAVTDSLGATTDKLRVLSGKLDDAAETYDEMSGDVAGVVRVVASGIRKYVIPIMAAPKIFVHSLGFGALLLNTFPDMIKRMQRKSPEDMQLMTLPKDIDDKLKLMPIKFLPLGQAVPGLFPPATSEPLLSIEEGEKKGVARAAHYVQLWASENAGNKPQRLFKKLYKGFGMLSNICKAIWSGSKLMGAFDAIKDLVGNKEEDDEECKKNKDCKKGYVCLKKDGEGKCKQDDDEDSPCDPSTPCKTGYTCKKEKCKKDEDDDEEGQACSSEQPCKTGQTCVKEKCKKDKQDEDEDSPCETSTDCKSGYECKSEKCKKKDAGSSDSSTRSSDSSSSGSGSGDDGDEEDELDCGTHGVEKEGKCKCKTGWKGTKCTVNEDDEDEEDDLNCGTHGVAKEGKCKCKSGWKGSKCDKSSGNDDDDDDDDGPLKCKNGQLKNGKCKCKKGWSGTTCSKEDKKMGEKLTCKNGGEKVEGKGEMARCKCVTENKSPTYYKPKKGGKSAKTYWTGPSCDDHDCQKECKALTEKEYKEYKTDKKEAEKECDKKKKFLLFAETKEWEHIDHTLHRMGGKPSKKKKKKPDEKTKSPSGCSLPTNPRTKCISKCKGVSGGPGFLSGMSAASLPSYWDAKSSDETTKWFFEVN